MHTAVLKLKLRLVNRAKEMRLLGMQEAFTSCTRFHLEHAVSLKTTSAKTLHHACYRLARESFPELPASTLQQARDKALAMYRGHLSRLRSKRRSSLPKVNGSLPLRLAAENLRVFPDRRALRVTTPNGFLWLPLVIAPCHQERVNLCHGVSELARQGRDWYLYLTVKAEDVPSNDGPHFGVDLGVANVAVLAGPGVVRFFDGKPLRYTRNRYSSYRQALQSKGKLGMVKRSKGKESRWASNMNHQVSREIVDIVAAASGVLHIERLLGIRERIKGTRKTNRMLHSWPFAQLLAFIQYKAALAGVLVVEEDPRHTSQRCSRCGHTERANRKQAAFRCQACGYQLHADLNAARNLAARGASSSGAPGVTPGLNGEVTGLRISHGNRNLASSTLEAVCFS